MSQAADFFVSYTSATGNTPSDRPAAQAGWLDQVIVQ
jgi:hypothetical protein